MSEKPKGKRDFSDIDNLERATESFMRGQRKALTGSHAGSRAFHTLNLHKLTRFGAVFAVIAVIVGTVVFAGIRFGKQDQDFLKPEETTAASDTTQTDPPAETTLPEETVTTEQPAQPIATLTSSRTQTAAATQTTSSASATETTGTGSSATTGTGATTSTTARTSAATSPVVQIPPAAATQAPSTAAPVTAPPVTAAQNVTAPTTARTTARTTVTTRATTTVRTTTVTTTVRTTTTVTTTTEPKVAVITITKLVVDGQTHYSGSCKENVHVTVKNTGNATLSGSYALSIRCVDAENIVHVGCTSGNVLSNITHTGEVMTLYYCGSLAPDAKDTIELTVLTQDPLLVCRAV